MITKEVQPWMHIHIVAGHERSTSWKRRVYDRIENELDVECHIVKCVPAVLSAQAGYLLINQPDQAQLG
jgi:hypothetical protein